MKYWWVNQTESAGHGLDAGCLWTQKKHHHKNADPFHKKIRSVCIGDPLISCTNGRVVAVGTVLPKAYAAPKSSDFGAVDSSCSHRGWRVDVSYTEFDKGISIGDNRSGIEPLLPSTLSPLDAIFCPSSLYLSEISEALFGSILSQTDYRYAPNRDADLDAILDAAEHQWLYKRLNDAVGREEKVVNLACARKGQGIFRSGVEEVEDGCPGSGIKDHQYLQVWHIKPWSVADNVERLDGNNGLLLSPHIGFLFVRGYVTFSGEGDMIISHQLGDDIAASWRIMAANKRQFTHKQKGYLRYHRENIFMC